MDWTHHGTACVAGNQRPERSFAPAPGSAKFIVHDALGNWMIQDVQMGRMICMTTRERDAKFIAEALNAYSTNYLFMRKEFRLS
jgi:hypothetical protein